MTRAIRRASVLIMAAVLAGCGIPAQGTPEPIHPPAGESLSTPTPPPDAKASGHVAEYLYFVDGNGGVVRVTRHLISRPSIDMVVKDLLAGPSDSEGSRGYTSALLGASVVESVQVNNGQVVVALATPVADTARNDEQLAYAQLVCTLTALPQISGVTFSSGGKPIAVPRGDGSYALALTAADYADLIHQH